MSEIKYYHHARFSTESGAVLPSLKIAYQTWGTPSAKGDNIIWVCHALTANSDVADWWPGSVVEGKFLDPTKYFIICANVLGSHYGTTGPLSVNESTGEPYYNAFPMVTVRDVVAAHKLLAAHLAVEKVHALIGGSIGGFQALEWAISSPNFAKHLILLATAAKASPWAVAINESQRMAIEADSSFGERRDDAGQKGMKAARSIALLSYRTSRAYNKTQAESKQEVKVGDFRAASYQQYQGEKLVSRFNVYSYYRLLQMQDSHNVARARGSVEAALGKVKSKTLIVAITTDILYTIDDHLTLYRGIKNSSLEMIAADAGHDSFLIEVDAISKMITDFIE